MPFKFKIGPDGKQKVVSMKPEEATKYQEAEAEFCGVCQNSGLVEEHQYCSCPKGVALRASEESAKISKPSEPLPEDRSAFNQGSHSRGGWQYRISFPKNEEDQS